MVKIKKKEKTAIFKSAFGTNIKLDILIKDSILKITVLRSVQSEICKRGIILGILVVWSLLSLVLNIFNTKLITAIIIGIFLDLCRLCTSIKEESILTIRGLGFQVTTKYIIGVKTIFIPEEQVQNIFINEVIFRNRVIYVLSLLTKDTINRENLIPLFFETLPRLASLKIIYKHLKAIQEQNVNRQMN
ncbi:uncharacterized protein LOC108916768 [Anoplophora glabripennis]|uniref:uncharacterized protein LOC108916768 n=1 Tax=Anoplophora glabripennis TaxID=217634 RepID=UPI0008747E62|nr:uncharacterized protein LOC108916768 [Anoplophora glabripennis]